MNSTVTPDRITGHITDRITDRITGRPMRVRPASTATNCTLDHLQEHSMTIHELGDIDHDVLATEPLAPDEQRPPGRAPDRPHEVGDMDESLDARSPVARCADGNGTMTGLFFSDHVIDIARAKAMCALCPLRLTCLADALEREEPWGVWGGELISGGRIVANKRPCGRPPKHPRAEVVYDEMGPVAIPA